MKVRVSIVSEFEKEFTEKNNSKKSILSNAITTLYDMATADLMQLGRVQVAKETWLEVEE